MPIYDQRIEFRCDKEMKMYLIGMDQDHSQLLRNLVDRHRLDSLDSTLINNKIKEHQEAIKELQNLKKQGSQLSNSEDIISEFHQDPGKPQIHDELSRSFCFNYFKEKYWPRIKNLPEFKLKNPVDVFNEIVEEK